MPLIIVRNDITKMSVDAMHATLRIHLLLIEKSMLQVIL